jgi:hypothetical protein
MAEITEQTDTVQKVSCEFGCIFFPNGQLCGDCRIPESDKCRLNLNKKRKQGQ